jgi:hypothetical protein
MSEAKETRDHDTIRRWVEERGGHPATVADTARQGEKAGLLRIDFDPPDEKLERISWDDFFEKFDREGLVFLYQDTTADGHISRFHKFVEKETAEQKHR